METVLDQEAFTTPLYSKPEAARIIGVPANTLRNWAHGYRYMTRSRGSAFSEPLITVNPRETSKLTVPYVGVAEAYVLTALKEAGMSTRNIRESVGHLKRRMNMPHALLNQRLKTDGVDLLYEYSGATEENAHGRVGLASVKDGQAVFREVVEQYLRTLVYSEGYAVAFSPRNLGESVIEVDPFINGGRPTFAATGTPLASVQQRISAGEDVRHVASDFGIPWHQVRVALNLER